jgi:hypothetical protein
MPQVPILLSLCCRKIEYLIQDIHSGFYFPANCGRKDAFLPEEKFFSSGGQIVCPILS